MATVMLRATTCEAVLREMKRATAKGYDQGHDDAHGSGHLVTEAVYRLTHMGEYPTDEAVKHEIVVALGLLFNAIDVIDRAKMAQSQEVEDELDDCRACDATLASCSRAEVCCEDCTHAGNWPPESQDSEVPRG